jgi:hypothetical protein
MNRKQILKITELKKINNSQNKTKKMENIEGFYKQTVTVKGKPVERLISKYDKNIVIAPDTTSTDRAKLIALSNKRASEGFTSLKIGYGSETLQSPTNKWMVQEDGYFYKLPETPKGMPEKKKGALIGRINIIDGELVYARYGDNLVRFIRTGKNAPFNFINVEETKSVPYHLYVIKNKEAYGRDNPSLVQWAMNVDKGIVANPPLATTNFKTDPKSSFTSNIGLDLGFDGDSNFVGKGKATSTQQAGKFVSTNNVFERVAVHPKGKTKKVVDIRVVDFKHANGKVQKRKILIFADGTGSNPAKWENVSSFDGSQSIAASMLDFSGGNSNLLDSDIVSKFSGNRISMNRRRRVQEESNFTGGAMPDFNGGSDSDFDGDSNFSSNIGMDLGIDGSSSSNDIRAFQSWYNKNKGGKLTVDGKWGAKTSAAWNASKGNYAKMETIKVKLDVKSPTPNIIASKDKVIFTEAELKALYAKSGSKAKFADWVKSDNAKNLANSAKDVVAAILAARAARQGAGTGGGSTDGGGRSNDGGGTPADTEKLILGMHPVTFGIVALITGVVVIGGIVVISKMNKAKIVPTA